MLGTNKPLATFKQKFICLLAHLVSVQIVSQTLLINDD